MKPPQPEWAHLSDADLLAMVRAMKRPHVGSYCLKATCPKNRRRIAHAHPDRNIAAKQELLAEVARRAAARRRDARCFACGRPLGANPHRADTRDAQVVDVGRECYRLIEAAGEDGYQPPRGGPRLWLLP